MTREEMVKRLWKPFMSIDYQDTGMQYPAECLLSAIDFDAEILTLTPIHEYYKQQDFKANLKFCSIPKRLKAVTLNGKKKEDPTENYIKAKKCP